MSRTDPPQLRTLPAGSLLLLLLLLLLTRGCLPRSGRRGVRAAQLCVDGLLHSRAGYRRRCRPLPCALSDGRTLSQRHALLIIAACAQRHQIQSKQQLAAMKSSGVNLTVGWLVL